MGLVGRYETYELLGKGSVGSVYRARDVLLDRDVAVKILHRNVSFDSDLSKTLALHGSIGAKLLHPNIATVFDFRETPEFSFLVSDLFEGTDLRFNIRSNTKVFFSLVQKIDLLAQVCDGLAHAHGSGVIHRDIKPSNIFIHERKYAKLLDFGVWRAPRQSAATKGGPAGTLDYVSPEQILTSQCEARSDLFSAAIVFFEFLVGGHPFHGPFIPRRIVEDTPEKLCDHDRLIPQSLDKLFEKALSKTLEKRIQTAEFFAEELRRVGQDLRADLISKPSVISLPELRQERETIPRNGRATDDPVDWRVAVLIRELHSFDDSLTFGDLEIAAGVLAKMRSLEAGDDRLSAAITDCQARLRSAEAQKDSLKATSRSSEESSVAPKPSTVGQQMRPSAKTALRMSIPPRLILAKRFAVRRVNEFTFWTQQFWSRFKLQVAHLTVGQKQIVATVFVAGLLLITSLLIYTLKTEPLGRSLVLAKIQVRQADLFEKPSASSRRLMSLEQGTMVGILGNNPTKGQQFVRVRAITGKNGPSPGYLRTGELTEWTSDDPAIAWQLLSTFRPGKDANSTVLRHFAGELQRFRERFPRSSHFAEADRERQRIGEILTNQFPRATPPAVEVADAAEKTSGAQELAKGKDAGTMMPPSKEALISSPTNIHDQAATARSGEELERILKVLPGLWDDGNLEEIVGLTQRALALAPENSQAKAWNAKARKAIRKLNAQ